MSSADRGAKKKPLCGVFIEKQAECVLILIVLSLSLSCRTCSPVSLPGFTTDDKHVQGEECMQDSHKKEVPSKWRKLFLEFKKLSLRLCTMYIYLQRQ